VKKLPTIFHHRKSGQARIRVRDKDYYLGPFGSETAQKNYDELIKRLGLDRPFADVGPLRADHTIKQLVDWFLGEAGKRYTTDNAKQYRIPLTLLATLYGPMRGRDFSPRELTVVRDRMIDQGLSLVAVARRTSRIRTLFRRASQAGLLPHGIWSALREIEPLAPNDRRFEPTPKREGCSWQDLATVCRQAGPAVRAMLLVQYWTGARTGEICGMQVEEIDRTQQTWIWRIKNHKNAWRGHQRVVGIGPKARRVLEPHLPAAGHVFLNRYGKPYTNQTYPACVSEAAARAGITGFHPYLLRHEAKNRVGRNHGLDGARVALGHDSLEMTSRYGSSIDLDLLVRIAEQEG